MAQVVSCGVVILNAQQALFVCHATGTRRWDLPKGVMEPGESALQTVARETWEETSLALPLPSLLDLGVHDYLPAKALHLFALRVAADAFVPDDCRCHTHFVHRVTGRPVPEVDAYKWMPRERLEDWCGKNLCRVLRGLDWEHLDALPEVARLPLR